MELIAIVLAVLIFGITEKKKVGGIYFWKLGRIGGSFYIKSPRKTPMIPPKESMGDKEDILVDRHRRMSYN